MRADRNGGTAKSVCVNLSSEHAIKILRRQVSKSYKIIGFYLFNILESSVFWYVSARYVVTALLFLN